MIRPQNLKISGGGEGFKAVVKDITFLGDTTSVLLVTDWGQEVWMRRSLSDLGAVPVGSAIRLTTCGPDCHCFLA